MTVVSVTVDLPDYVQATELAGKLYRLTLSWNGREQAWYVSVATAAGEELVSGRRLVADWPLLDRFKDARLPAGQMLVVDLDGTRADPLRNTLGGRTALMFVPASEVPR